MIKLEENSVVNSPTTSSVGKSSLLSWFSNLSEVEDSEKIISSKSGDVTSVYWDVLQYVKILPPFHLTSDKPAALDLTSKFMDCLFLTSEKNLYYIRNNQCFCLTNSGNVYVGKFTLEMKSKLLKSLTKFRSLSCFCIYQKHNYPRECETLLDLSIFSFQISVSQLSGNELLHSKLKNVFSRMNTLCCVVAKKVPKLMIYLRRPVTLLATSESVKCIFMSNLPLPEFHIQWKDKTRLSYCIETGRIELYKFAKEKIHWSGHLRTPPSFLPRAFKDYLIESEQIICICFMEARRRNAFSFDQSVLWLNPQILCLASDS